MPSSLTALQNTVILPLDYSPLGAQQRKVELVAFLTLRQTTMGGVRPSGTSPLAYLPHHHMRIKNHNQVEAYYA